MMIIYDYNTRDTGYLIGKVMIVLLYTFVN